MSRGAVGEIKLGCFKTTEIRRLKSRLCMKLSGWHRVASQGLCSKDSVASCLKFRGWTYCLQWMSLYKVHGAMRDRVLGNGKMQLIRAVDHHRKAAFISPPTLSVQKTSKTGWMGLIYKVTAGFHWAETAQNGTRLGP